jgi:hypothetical protein
MVLLSTAGFLLFGYGLYLIYPPAVLLFAGALLAATGFSVHLGNERIRAGLRHQKAEAEQVQMALNIMRATGIQVDRIVTPSGLRCAHCGGGVIAGTDHTCPDRTAPPPPPADHDPGHR